MDLASSPRAAENGTRWEGIFANLSVVPRRPSMVMGIAALSQTGDNSVTFTELNNLET